MADVVTKGDDVVTLGEWTAAIDAEERTVTTLGSDRRESCSRLERTAARKMLANFRIESQENKTKAELPLQAIYPVADALAESEAASRPRNVPSSQRAARLSNRPWKISTSFVDSSY